MSMEIYVLSDIQLSSIEEWQSAIDAQRFPLRLSAETPFAKLQGALPVVLEGRSTAFECVHWSASALAAETPKVDLERRWSYALAFRWGADIDAGVAASLAAAAYAIATNGRVLDCAAGELISPNRAIEVARELDGARPLIEEAVRRALARPRT